VHGDLPEDPGGPEDDADGLQRGWLPPDDRLWRHPSEVARLGPPRRVPSFFETVVGGLQPGRTRHGALGAGVVGAVAVATTVVVVLALVDNRGATSSGARDEAAGIEVSTTSMTSMVLGRDVMGLVSSVRPSLVGLEPLDASGAAGMTGVVLPGGDLIVTAASAVAGATQLDVITANGRRQRGQVLGTDAHSGVAVVSTDGGMVPATFGDEDVETDDLAVVACMCSDSALASQHAPVGTAAGVGMVTGVDTGVSLEGGPELADAIEAELPLGPTSRGGVLLDTHGRVIGILDGQTVAGNDTLGVFVPAPLAESVALELAQNHRVEHGWLGVVCRDEGAGGPTVTGFLPGSPAAAAGLRGGDVVVAVGTQAVDSVADLQEHLYAVRPGQTVRLSVKRDGAGPTVVAVALAGAPAN